MTESEKEEDLEKVFSKYGEVSKIFIVRHPHSNVCRGFAFVTMKTEKEAQEAVKGLEQFTLNNNKIVVEFAKSNNPRDKTPGRYLGTSKVSLPYSRREYNY